MFILCFAIHLYKKIKFRICPILIILELIIPKARYLCVQNTDLKYVLKQTAFSEMFLAH